MISGYLRGQPRYFGVVRRTPKRHSSLSDMHIANGNRTYGTAKQPAQQHRNLDFNSGIRIQKQDN